MTGPPEKSARQAANQGGRGWNRRSAKTSKNRRILVHWPPRRKRFKLWRGVTLVQLRFRRHRLLSRLWKIRHNLDEVETTIQWLGGSLDGE